MRHVTRALAAWLLVVVASASALGQTAPKPAAVPPPAPAADSTAKPAAATVQADAYTYNPQGRRDPFVSLLQRGTDSKTLQGARRPEGIAGLSVGELSVRGVMQSRDGYVAILQGPDGKTYIARPADRLLDGTIKAITDRGLVIVQEVNDPLSLVKQKEVRKGLRAFDEGK